MARLPGQRYPRHLPVSVHWSYRLVQPCLTFCAVSGALNSDLHVCTTSIIAHLLISSVPSWTILNLLCVKHQIHKGFNFLLNALDIQFQELLVSFLLVPTNDEEPLS